MGELNEKILVPKDGYLSPSSPAQCLTQLLISKNLADLTVIIPGHSDNFKVHRLVLSMWSHVFQAMLFGPMSEGDTITLIEDPPEAFDWLLRYMYTGHTELPSIELTLQVFQLANKYFMSHLMTVCSEYLIKNVIPDSVPEVLDVATLLDDETLIKKCEEVLENNPDLFFTSPTIGSLKSDIMEQLLKKDLQISSESVIFQGILNWGKAHLKSKQKEITPIMIRQEVEKFLPQIHFLSMSLEEFVKHVIPDTILTLTEIQAILLNIAGVPEVNIPSLFSTKKEFRNKFHISLLNTCQISHANRVSNTTGKYNTSNPVIFDQLKPKEKIYLSKIEYTSDIGSTGTLTVKDSSGQQLQNAHFDGRIAKFDVPLKMLPEENYSFNLSGSTYNYDDMWSIKCNELISGRMVNNIAKAFDLHYWK